MHFPYCRYVFALILAVLFSLSSPTGATAEPTCEIDRPVVFADLNWESNQFHTQVAKFIVERGYGCKTDIVPGDTLPLTLALIRGDADVMMELWEENIREVWDKAERDGKAIKAGVNFPDAVQGWYIPRYLAEGAAKGLRHVRDLPKFKDLFRDPEEPDKGRFTNCPAGWGCEDVNSRKLIAYGLDDHFTNFRVGTGVALDAAIESAIKRKKPILFYYWSPTWIMGKFDLVMLEEPAYDAAKWEALQKADRPTDAVAYPVVAVEVALNKAFADQAPKLTAFFKNYRTSGALTSAMLSHMREADTDAVAGARHFLKTKADVWRKWLPADVAGRVAAALN